MEQMDEHPEITPTSDHSDVNETAFIEYAANLLQEAVETYVMQSMETCGSPDEAELFSHTYTDEMTTTQRTDHVSEFMDCTESSKMFMDPTSTDILFDKELMNMENQEPAIHPENLWMLDELAITLLQEALKHDHSYTASPKTETQAKDNATSCIPQGIITFPDVTEYFQVKNNTVKDAMSTSSKCAQAGCVSQQGLEQVTFPPVIVHITNDVTTCKCQVRGCTLINRNNQKGLMIVAGNSCRLQVHALDEIDNNYLKKW